MKTLYALLAIVLTAGLLLTACGGAGSSPTADQLKIVATTNIMGDVVVHVAGEHAELTTLLAPGVDPHSYEPSARDLAALEDADLIFINGLGLEAFMDTLASGTEMQSKIIIVSAGIETLSLEEVEEEEEEGEDAHPHNIDPHVWLAPANVITWVEVIEHTLSAADLAHAEAYANNAAAYTGELNDLHGWLISTLSAIPAQQRVLVTDHDSFGYFAEAYGFQIVGALIPSYSTLSEPSAGELAALEEAILNYGVQAIFIDSSINPALAEQVAADTGIQLVPLYTGSLSAADGPAASYIEMMRYNGNAILEALK
jgi:ABC-type Zn uptake system ZnuABC Zn-binding protein ZnuA